MSIYAISANGTPVQASSVTTLAQAAVAPSYAGCEIHVSSHQVVSTAIAWPTDRRLVVEPNGYITFSGVGALTGISTVYPEWFGDKSTQAAMLAAMGVLKSNNGGTYHMGAGTYYPPVAQFGNLTIEGEGQGVRGNYYRGDIVGRWCGRVCTRLSNCYY